MPLKESSDEFNPTVAAPPDAIPAPKRLRGPLDYSALAIATCGVGYLPLMPGTFGSLVGLAVFWLIGSWPLQLLAILLITALGIWAASRTERLLRLKDPGIVVVDEVAGQMIALLPLSVWVVSSWKVWTLVSFALFRAFDILKPYPGRKFERLRGGLGIMADDLVAGAYAAVGTAICITILG